MRARVLALTVDAALVVSTAFAHGPQIQITNDNNRIVSRELILDEPYVGSLTPPKSVYVVPLLPYEGVWYARPNTAPSMTIPGAPQYLSGPGLAYGHDMLDGGPQAFAQGSVVSVSFTDGFKRWNGAMFDDAGTTQLKGYRGSNVNISMPPENLAVTSDAGPFDSVSFAPIAANYAPNAHSSLSFALLGDGNSPTSASPDGIYLLSLQISSTQSGLAASEPYYFVLNKNATYAQVAAAVQSLGVAPAAVQWLVPEPGSAVLLTALALLIAGVRGRRRETK